MNLNLDFKKIPEMLAPVTVFFRKYAVFICFVFVIGVFSFMVFRINQYTNAEPSEDALNEKLLEVKRPKIDAKAVEKIEQLEDRNVEVQALFDSARDNPFQD